MNEGNTILKERIFFGEEQVLCDQTLQITDTIIVEGGLKLKNCIIDCKHGRFEVLGTLFAESCVIENPGQDSFCFDCGAYAIIRDTRFIFTAGQDYSCSILNQRPASWVSLEHCIFSNTASIRFSGMYSLFHIPYGKTENSMFYGFSDLPVLSAHQILACTFERCGAIYGGELEENGIIADSVFINCGSIRADDSTVKSCHFKRLKADLCVERSTVEDCIFEEIDCDYEALLCIADSLVTRCSFREIRLIDECRLVTAIDSGDVEQCTFENISIEREPPVLFYGETLSKGIFKKRRTFEVVDEKTCIGLDNIQII